MAKFTYDHIHLRSPDPEATARWYERMFGAEIPGPCNRASRGSTSTRRRQRPLRQWLRAMASTAADHAYQGLDHFGLSVSGIDAIAADLKAKGVEFTKEPTTIRPGVRVCFIRGPQGVSIELLDRNV
jgi:catechol 2,3-dioxygenase-like lactoylglutathione lyase family enzyme